MEPWRAELYHHGIKGQKWGVRKGPPYPLNARNHTTAEKKAGWRQSLSKTTSEREQTSAPDKEPDERKKGMTSQKKKILTATATVAALGVIGAVAVSNPKIRDLAATGARATEDVFKLTRTEKMWLDGDVSKIWRAEAKTMKKTYDPDFYKGWVQAMKDMEATDKRAKKAQARSLKTERRAQRKANDEFFKSMQRAQEEAAKKQAEQERRRKRAELAKQYQGTNKFGDLMIGDLLLMM